MKYYYLLLFTLIGAMGFSCTDEGRIERREDKIEGSWEFEKAFYKRDGALFRDNVIDDFEDDIIHFHADETAIYVDQSLDASFDGAWFVDIEYFEDGDDLDREYFVDMEFYDWVNDETFFYYGNVTFLTKNKLNLSVWDGNGEYTFKLRCID